MKIIKTSQKMFETYGMETMLADAFKKYYAKLVEDNVSEAVITNLQNDLEAGMLIPVGTMKIGNFIKQIVDRHGAPLKKDYPKTVTFVLLHPESQYVKGRKGQAIFLRDPFNSNLYIGKVANDITNVVFSNEFETTMQHEFQHLLSDMYNKNIFDKTKSPNSAIAGTIEYYSNPQETQAFCAEIAKEAFNRWRNLIEFRIAKWTPERIINNIPSWRSDKDINNNVKLMLLSAFRDFDKKKKGMISSNNDLKNKYLQTSYRNFIYFINKYLNDLEAKNKGAANENI